MKMNKAKKLTAQQEINKVKDELPDVKVMLENGEVVTGYVKGRMLPFARVYIEGRYWGTEFSWEAVTRAINTGEPLKIY